VENTQTRFIIAIRISKEKLMMSLSIIKLARHRIMRILIHRPNMSNHITRSSQSRPKRGGGTEISTIPTPGGRSTLKGIMGLDTEHTPSSCQLTTAALGRVLVVPLGVALSCRQGDISRAIIVNHEIIVLVEEIVVAKRIATPGEDTRGAGEGRRIVTLVGTMVTRWSPLDAAIGGGKV
jgi:hypothetical protein